MRTAPAESLSTPEWLLGALDPFLRAEAAAGRPSSRVSEWRFQSRYFSSLIYFTTAADSERPGRFLAKFPKATRRRGYSSLPPRTPEDIELAAHEYRAFQALSRDWPLGETAFVEPRFFDPSTGLLVFDHLEGHDVYGRALPRRLFWRRTSPPGFTSTLRSLGRALGQYHVRTARRVSYKFDDLLGKLDQGGRQVNVALPAWAGQRESREVHVVPGIKGFEVRNARKEGNKIWLYDPGRLRDEPAEADVARFLVSLRMLGWGTPYFPLPLPTSYLEDTFVASYCEQRSLDEAALALLLLREVLWNWREALEVLAARELPSLARSLLGRLYVEPSFRRLWSDATREGSGRRRSA